MSPIISHLQQETSKHKKHTSTILVPAKTRPIIRRQQTPILAFCRDWNLKDIIGSNKIEFNKVKQKSLTVAKRNCTSCWWNNRALCCRQIIKKITFQSNQNKRTYTIYHNMNWKNKNTVYLMECTKCELKYVRNPHLQLFKLDNVLKGGD